MRVFFFRYSTEPSRALYRILHNYREEPADWTAEDYQVVQHVLEQYPKSLSNRRALVMDMLKRRFPHRSVLDVVG